MSKFYEIEDLLSLSNYAKKYEISLRKIYRYIGDSLIEHFMIDGIPFLPDKEISLLKETHNRYELINNVKTLTSKTLSVKTLTSNDNILYNVSENQIVNSVKILTERGVDNVNILTIREDELKLMVCDDSKLSINNMKAKEILFKKYNI